MAGTLSSAVNSFKLNPYDSEPLYLYKKENRLNLDDLDTEIENFFNLPPDEQQRLEALLPWFQGIFQDKLMELISTENLDKKFIKNVNRLFPNEDKKFIIQIIQASIKKWNEPQNISQILTILNHAKLLLNDAQYSEVLGEAASMLVPSIHWDRDEDEDEETKTLDLGLNKIFTADFLKAQPQQLQLWEKSPYREYFQRKIEALIKDSQIDEIQPYILSSTLLDFAIDEMIKNQGCTAEQFQNIFDLAKQKSVTSKKYPDGETLIQTGLEKLHAGILAAGVNQFNKDDRIEKAREAIEKLLINKDLVGDRKPCVELLCKDVPSSMIASILQTNVFCDGIEYNHEVAGLLLEKIKLNDETSLRTLTARHEGDNQRTIVEMQAAFYEKLKNSNFKSFFAFHNKNKDTFEYAQSTTPLMQKLNQQLAKLNRDLGKTSSQDEKGIIEAKITLVKNLIDGVQNRDPSKIKLPDYKTFAKATAQRNLFSRLFNRESKTMELAAEVYQFFNPSAVKTSHDFKQKLHESMMADNTQTSTEDQKPK